MDSGAIQDSGADAGTDAWSWQSWPGLNVARHSGGAAEVNGSVYVFGGMTGMEAQIKRLSSVERYDATAKKWIYVKPMPAAQCCFASAVLGGKIYVAGGYDSTFKKATSAVMAYDAAADSWTPGPAMPSPRANGSAFVHDGKIGVVGGWAEVGEKPVDSLVWFDAAKNTWTTASVKLKTPRVSCLARVVGDTLHVVGGYPEKPTSASMYGTDLVETLDLVAKTWAAGPSIAAARGQLGGGVIDGKLVIAGGYGLMGHAKITELLDGSWKRLPDMATGRAYPLAAASGRRLVVAGGGEFMGSYGFKPLSSVEVLSAPSKP